MACYGFDGTDDGVAIALGDMAPTGAHTFAALIYRGVSNAWHNVLAIQNGSAVGVWSAEIADDSAGFSNQFGEYGTSPDYGVAAGAVAASAWSIVVVTKAAGSSIPRIHRCQSGGSWTHANATNGAFSIASGAAAGKFGLYPGNIDDFNGRMAAACWWNSVLSDAEIEALSFTSFAAWRDHAVTPNNCWKFKWEDGNLVDVIGTADETSRTGTATATEPPGWSWDAPAIIGTTEIDSSSATGSQSITVPGNCDAVVLFVAGYGPLTFQNKYFSDGILSLGTSNFTVAEGGADDEQYHCSAAFVIFDPPTGSQTFDWDWAGTSSPQDGVHMTFVFLAGTGNSIRSHAGDQWATNTTTVNVGALNVEPGDIVLAWGENYAGTASSFTWAGGVTKYADYHTGGAGYNTTAASLATANPSSSGTITPTLAWTANASDGSMIVLAIPAPSGAQEYTDQSTVSLKLTPSGTDEYTQANPPQKIYPTSDVSVGSWTPTPSSPATLYDKIDETTLSLTDYITSDAVGGSQEMWPLKISSNGRYLTYQNDTPFLIKGDSTQTMCVNISLTEAEAYLDNRLALGFNAVWLHLLLGQGVYGRANGSTYDGITPFTTGTAPADYDLQAPRETYWARMDAMLALIEEREMVAFVDPAETINWVVTLIGNGVSDSQSYGEWIGNRYGSLKHVIWLFGNDFQTWNDLSGSGSPEVAAMAAGIRTNAPDQLITIMLEYHYSLSSDFDHWQTPITGPDLQLVYSYYNIGWSMWEGRAAVSGNPIPTFLGEANYEWQSVAFDSYTNLRQRIQEWSTMCSGSTGHLYGNGYTAEYISLGERSEWHTESLDQYMMMNDFFEARAWWELEPDTTHTVLTTGYGTYAQGTNVVSGTFAPCAITPDDTFAVIYSPNGANRTLTVDMTEFSGTVTARWLDPSDVTGALNADSASPLANTGSHNFITPSGTNSDGDTDWVLVLEVL